MDELERIFGTGSELTISQMCCRSVVVFAIALALLRLSGKRAFGLNMPLDCVLTFLLGSMFSRAIVGASPFFPTIASAGVIVVIYRVFGHLSVLWKSFGWLAKGKPTVIYEHGQHIKKNMNLNMITERDMLEVLRLQAHTDDYSKVECMVVERTGQISVVLKKETKGS